MTNRDMLDYMYELRSTVIILGHLLKIEDMYLLEDYLNIKQAIINETEGLENSLTAIMEELANNKETKCH